MALVVKKDLSLDPFHVTLSRAIGVMFGPKGISNLVEQFLICHNNSGFHQYFYNSSGDYALDTPDALDQIGAHYTAKLLKNAIDLFPGGPHPRDWQQRREQLDSLSEAARARLEKLDSKFYEYRDPLEDLQVKYMIAHQEKIQV
jgi:hypothetical protein